MLRLGSPVWCSLGAVGSQFWQVDLGGVHSVTQFVIDHAGAGGEQTGWNTKAFTISVSTDGTNFGTVVGSAGYTFDPAIGNTATIVFPSTTTVRYLRLNFTANTGWPAGQVSEFRVYAS